MFLRGTTRKKDGKEHRYFSVVRRVSGGKTVQRTVLYLARSTTSNKQAGERRSRCSTNRTNATSR